MRAEEKKRGGRRTNEWVWAGRWVGWVFGETRARRRESSGGGSRLSLFSFSMFCFRERSAEQRYRDVVKAKQRKKYYPKRERKSSRTNPDRPFASLRLSLHLLRQPLRIQQTLHLLQNPRPVPNPRMNQPAHTPLVPNSTTHSLPEPFPQRSSSSTRLLSQPERILERLSDREEPLHERDDLTHVGLLSVDDSVGSGVEGVGCDVRTSRGERDSVEFGDDGDDGFGDVVEVEDRREGIETHGVELVGILHGELSERIEILGLDGGDDLLHPPRNDVLDPVLQEFRRLNGELHSSGGSGGLLDVRDDADESMEGRPVGSRSDFDGVGVETGREDSLFPSDETTKEGSTGGAGALTGDEGELGRVGGEGVESGEGGDESGESGGGGGESSGGGEVVVGGDVDFEG